VIHVYLLEDSALLKTEMAKHARANFPDPDIIAAEIIEDLRAALGQFDRNR
jgi:hypothetical protein